MTDFPKIEIDGELFGFLRQRRELLRNPAGVVELQEKVDFLNSMIAIHVASRLEARGYLCGGE